MIDRFRSLVVQADKLIVLLAIGPHEFPVAVSHSPRRTPVEVKDVFVG